MDTTFVVSGTSFTFPTGTIPQGSLLYSLMTTSMFVERDEKKNIILRDVDETHMAIIHNYLVNKVIPDVEMLPIFDYFNIPLIHSYGLSQMRENHLRSYMYDPDFVEDEINTDKHYGLTRITEALWKNIKAARSSEKNLLFTEKRYTLRPWSEVTGSLKELDLLFELMPDKIMVAGGRILSALCGTKSSDVDIFFHQTNADEAETFLKNLVYHLIPPDSEEQIEINNDGERRLERRFIFPQLLRTKNAVTITEQVAGSGNWIEKTIPIKEYQCILRLYQSASEILHGFDVDCCSVGYDGKDLWITDRALYALVNETNTVNFERMSPSYIDRLIKYGTRGFAVAIPNFSKASVNTKEIELQYNEQKERIAKRAHMYQLRNDESRAYLEVNRYVPTWKKFFTKLDGIDRLLFIEHHCIMRKWGKNVVSGIEEMAEEKSDYSPNPYKKFGSSKQHMISQTISHLLRTKRQYPEHSAKYRRRLRVFNNFYESTFGEEDFDHELLDKDELHALGFTSNMLRTNGTFDFVKHTSRAHFPHRRKERQYADEVLSALLHLSKKIYDGLGTVMPWTIPRHIQFKTINPGEQTTGTFNKLVLEDHSVWYKGHFYNF
jgi:hypothetical protein